MLDFLGLDSEQFPELLDSGEIIGSLSAAASRETGLTEDTLVITGALDQAAGAIGAGNLSSGICSETTGSALAALAGAAIGIFKNIEEGYEKIVELGGRISPNRGNQIVYQKGFQKYQNLYQSLIGVFEPE